MPSNKNNKRKNNNKSQERKMQAVYDLYNAKKIQKKSTQVISSLKFSGKIPDLQR